MSRIAIVTGAASGVGAATARVLAERGTRVVGVDLRWEDDAVPGVHVAGDVTDADTWAQALAAAERLGGAPDGLVLNAAQLAVGALLDVAEADLRRVFEVNVFAVAHGLRTLLPAMIAGGGGSVVAVASVDALLAEQGLAAYCASKGAVVQLIRSVALDYARAGIRANCVCPGATDTPLLRRHVAAAADPERFLREKAERHPVGRIRSAEEVAEVIAFLLDERSAGMTGTTVTVDGGLTASFDFQASAVASSAAPASPSDSTPNP